MYRYYLERTNNHEIYVVLVKSMGYSTNSNLIITNRGLFLRPNLWETINFIKKESGRLQLYVRLLLLIASMIKGNMYSDAALITAIGSGDQLNNAIFFIYQQYSSTIQSFIIANSGSSQDAEDIFQETVVAFIDLVKKKKFRGEATIKTFLVAIARNLWLNELKKRERSEVREKLFENNREGTEADVSDYIVDREMKQQFVEVLNKLGESCKQLLTMFYYENLSMKDMLQHLPYENEQVVRNKKYKCLQSLTELVKQNPVIARLVNQLVK